MLSWLKLLIKLLLLHLVGYRYCLYTRWDFCTCINLLVWETEKWRGKNSVQNSLHMCDKRGNDSSYWCQGMKWEKFLSCPELSKESLTAVATCPSWGAQMLHFSRYEMLWEMTKELLCVVKNCRMYSEIHEQHREKFIRIIISWRNLSIFPLWTWSIGLVHVNRLSCQN